MNYSILTIGDEILIGKIVNTNASFFSKELNILGAKCKFQVTTRDDEKEVMDALSSLLHFSDLVIVTGGLGVTPDDITKTAIANFIGEEIEINERALTRCQEYYDNLNVVMTKEAEGFVKIPTNSTLMYNSTGCAAGFVSTYKGKHIAVFPGPPHELVPMFYNEFLPIYKEIADIEKLDTRYFKIFDGKELDVVEKVNFLIEQYKNKVVFSTYCGNNETTLVLRQEGKISKAEFDNIGIEISNIFGKNLYTYNNLELQDTLVDILIHKNFKLSIAESITGGMIASKIVSVSNASKVFLEGIVSYSNESKISRLYVDNDIIENEGAVSELCARQMCEGLLKNPLCDIAVATTGVAGPNKDEKANEVGTAFIAVGKGDVIKVYEHKFVGTREIIREKCSKFAMFYIINLVKFNQFI